MLEHVRTIVPFVSEDLFFFAQHTITWHKGTIQPLWSSRPIPGVQWVPVLGGLRLFFDQALLFIQCPLMRLAHLRDQGQAWTQFCHAAWHSVNETGEGKEIFQPCFPSFDMSYLGNRISVWASIHQVRPRHSVWPEFERASVVGHEKCSDLVQETQHIKQHQHPNVSRQHSLPMFTTWFTGYDQNDRPMIEIETKIDQAATYLFQGALTKSRTWATLLGCRKCIGPSPVNANWQQLSAGCKHPVFHPENGRKCT